MLKGVVASAPACHGALLAAMGASARARRVRATRAVVVWVPVRHGQWPGGRGRGGAAGLGWAVSGPGTARRSGGAGRRAYARDGQAGERTRATAAAAEGARTDAPL